MNVKTLSLTALGSLILLTGCDQLKDLSYSTTPNPLEMHGDSVAISVSVTIPPKGIKKKVTAEMTPKLGDISLGSWLIHGEKVEGNGQSISFKPGGTATFTDVVAYHPSMENTQLVSFKVISEFNNVLKVLLHALFSKVSLVLIDFASKQ